MKIRCALIGGMLALSAIQMPANAQDKIDPAIVACFLVAKETHKAATTKDVVGSIIDGNKASVELDMTDATGRRIRHVEHCYFSIDGTREWALASTEIIEATKNLQEYTKEVEAIRKSGGVTPEIAAKYLARFEVLQERSRLALANLIGRTIPLMNYSGYPIPAQNTRLSEPNEGAK